MFPYSRAELKQQAKASLAGKWGKVVALYCFLRCNSHLKL